MTDQKGLRLIGFAYGGLTAVVLLVAVLVVTAHLNAPTPAWAGASIEAGASERLAVLPQ